MTNVSLPRRARAEGRAAQDGIVMFVALIVLVIMSLAGLAMMRQIGSGLSIAGNIAFKQGATALADLGTEQGITNVVTWAVTLATNNDNVAAGYWSSAPADVDPTDALWTQTYWPTAQSVTAPGAAGNAKVQYVIHRLCNLPNAADSAPLQQCAGSAQNGGSHSSGAGYGGGSGNQTVVAPYYRVTTKVIGPRNTVSYTQVVFKAY